jgi:hypothetical protein
MRDRWCITDILLRLVMADFEQTYHSLAKFERQEAPCQVVRLAWHPSAREKSSKPFFVQAYVDDHTLTATAETAKVAFAKAIEWHVVGKLADVSISDGARSYSITEFSSAMALIEIAHTIKTDVEADEETFESFG